MVAEGELVFVDTFGLEQRVAVTLTAQSSFNGNSPLTWLVQPSNAIMMIMLLLAISIVTGGGARAPNLSSSAPQTLSDSEPAERDFSDD